jgi:phage shock protein A
MKERIAGRVGRIISSSVNALVDALENIAPEMVLEEAIREIDGAIDEVKTELGRTISQSHLAEQRLAAQRKRHSELSQQTRLAVDQGRDDLAEAAIAQQMDIEVQIPILEQAVSEASAKTKELEGYVTALKAKQREMREELRRFSQSKNQTTSGQDPTNQRSVADRVDKAGSAFDRIMEKSSGLPGGRADLAHGAKLAELEELARRNRIKERLAAFKADSE